MEEVKFASLRKNTAWMLAGRLARILVQAAYFVLLARSLGVSQYGAFIAAASLAGILSPFASVGTGNLLIKHVARDRSAFRRCWAEALATTLVSGALLTGLGLLAARFLLPSSVPLGIVFPLILAELIFARFIDIAGQAFMAFEQLRHTALMLLGLSVARMLAASALMLLYRHPSAAAWANLYLASTIVPAVCSVWLVNLRLGTPLPAYSLRGRELLQGVFFSISLSAQTIYNDLDKTMLARLSGLMPAGLYGAAYRIIDVAGTPLGALTASTYSRFFQHGNQGLAAAVQFARTLLPTVLLYGLACTALLVLTAPLLLPVLGTQYADSITAVRWLAPIVLLRCVHYMGADALSGADHQGLRSLIQVVVAVTNIALNIYLLPRYSWRGAVGSSLACDALLAVLIWAAIGLLQMRTQLNASARSAAAIDGEFGPQAAPAVLP